jgi:hypothetical protein
MWQTKDQRPDLIKFLCNKQELNWIWSLVFGLPHLRRSRFVHPKGTELDLVLGLWTATFKKKSICSLQRNTIGSGPWSLVCHIWEEVDLFIAKELSWIWSLVFGLQELRRSRFAKELNWIWSLVFGLLDLRRRRCVHCKGTELDLVFGLWSATFENKSICSLQRSLIGYGTWSLVCKIWEEVDLFIAKELNWIWSLVFGLLDLGRRRFIHCKGTKLDLVLGLWSATFERKSICSLQRNWIGSGPWSLVCHI